MSQDAKPTNPKDAIGSGKLPLDLVPDTIEGEVALAYLEGALKYGRFNWRVAGVRASIYRAALRRHLARWWNGEDRDKVTRVKHLASVIACAGILLDAELCGKLTDDRPPAVDLDKLFNVEDQIAHLKDLFKDHDPKQWTIHDAEQLAGAELAEAALQAGGKPTWDIAPEAARYLAQQPGGEWYFYEYEPSHGLGYWCKARGAMWPAGQGAANADWKQTLEGRKVIG